MLQTQAWPANVSNLSSYSCTTKTWHEFLADWTHVASWLPFLFLVLLAGPCRRNNGQLRGAGPRCLRLPSHARMGQLLGGCHEEPGYGFQRRSSPGPASSGRRLKKGFMTSDFSVFGCFWDVFVGLKHNVPQLQYMQLCYKVIIDLRADFKLEPYSVKMLVHFASQEILLKWQDKPYPPQDCAQVCQKVLTTCRKHHLDGPRVAAKPPCSGGISTTYVMISATINACKTL